MANPNVPLPPSDDLLDQIFGFPNLSDGSLAGTNAAPAQMMMLQLSSGDGTDHVSAFGGGEGTAGAGGFNGPLFPLGLSLEHGKGGFFKPEEGSGSSKRFHEEVVDSRASSFKNVFHGHSMPSPVAAAPNPPLMRPRVRARRGQATDPHSIAERLRRERIAERIRALQDLVPSVSKTDRSVMLDQIVDYVKFLRLQVKVLSMSRLGGASAVAPLVTDMPLSTVEDETGEGGMMIQPMWEKWSNDGIEKQVAKLMEENVGDAMQLLQSKDLCVMPISLATAIYDSQPPDISSFAEPETNSPP